MAAVNATGAYQRADEDAEGAAGGGEHQAEDVRAGAAAADAGAEGAVRGEGPERERPAAHDPEEGVCLMCNKM